MADSTLLLKSIPDVPFPAAGEVPALGIEEEIVDLSEFGLLCDSKYWEQGIPGSLEKCYARKSVAWLLGKAQSLLPDDCRFLIYDAYRPIAVQQSLWDMYRSVVSNENPGLSADDIDKKTSHFVSKPSYNPSYPSLHNTGGAVDLTIIDKYGNPLDMGTEFDDFTEYANTAYFEHTDNEIVKQNRRLLYYVMTEVGFVNLPSEWWHYEYGSKFWGYFTKNAPIYKGADFTEKSMR